MGGLPEARLGAAAASPCSLTACPLPLTSKAARLPCVAGQLRTFFCEVCVESCLHFQEIVLTVELLRALRVFWVQRPLSGMSVVNVFSKLLTDSSVSSLFHGVLTAGRELTLGGQPWAYCFPHVVRLVFRTSLKAGGVSPRTHSALLGLGAGSLPPLQTAVSRQGLRQARGAQHSMVAAAVFPVRQAC